MTAGPEAVLGALPVGVVVLDPEGRVAFANDEACRLLGRSAATLAGRPLGRALGEDHPLAALVREAAARGEDLARAAVEIRRPFEEPVRADLRVTRIDDGEPPARVVTLVDRTGPEELRGWLERRERTGELAALVRGLAHELRNPLGGIRGCAQLLLEKLDDPALLRYAALVRDETERVTRLLDELAQLMRPEDLRRVRTNLHAVLDRVLDLERADPLFEGIEVVRAYDPSIPEIDADPDRLAQVFLNLVRNAAAAMEHRGTLTLRTRVEGGVRLRRGARDARLVSIDVEDTGPGIDPEDLPRIFAPFVSRRPGGTGLGLAIAQHWVVAHGGEIRVESERGRGTRFRVVLPVER